MITAVNLRQGGGTARAPKATVDGIRIGETWEDAVLASQSAGDGAGFRLLGAPVQGVTVGTLAGINLVQSVAGQYPTYPDDNVFLGYNGNTTNQYVAATDVVNPVAPGRGFFWYLFDQDLVPGAADAGGGTSRSYVVPERLLFAQGTVNTTDVTVAPVATADGFYMLANPFAQPFAVSGLTQTGATTLGANIQVYVPGTGPSSGFIATPRATANLSMWQGFFAEVSGGATPTFSFAAASRNDIIAAPATTARPAARTELALRLDGATVAGATHDEAAIVRIDGATSAGWDAGDASKLTPPGVYALLSPVGTRDGAARRQAVLSLPETADVTLAFTATHAGRFTITAEAMGLPAGATLYDRVEKKDVSLANGYSFDSEATAWTERFVVSFGRATAGEGTPAGFALGALYPNPSVGRAAVELRVDTPQTVRATVVDALGRTVATVFDGVLAAGQSQTLTVDTAGFAPGVYVVRVQGTTFSETRRLTVAR